MISAFRHFLGTWAARGFFMLLVGVFVAWGVGSDVLRMLTSDPAVAIVGGRNIYMPEVQEAYTRQLAQVSRSLGTNIDPTPEIKKAVAAQALQGVIVQAAMENAVTGMGLVMPDDALRQTVFELPAFKGGDGAFSRDMFQTVLRNNNYSESRFLALMRGELTQRQLLGAVRAGTSSPDVLTRAVFSFQHEARVAEVVNFPFLTAPKPDAPTEAQQARWYDNHKDLYSTREYRTIETAVLALDTVTKDVQITDADLQAAWEANKAAMQQAERRSVQVILTQDAERAKALATAWISGTDWAEMQKKAQADGDAPVEISDATRDEFPAPELAEAVFNAPPSTVPAPVKSALGWHVLKVTGITGGGNKTFEQAASALRAQLQMEKAADLIDSRANKLDDAIAGGARLADLPPDLGAAVVTVTIDSAGLDKDGKPVVLPGGDALRAALLVEAFRAKQGESPHLIDAPRDPAAPQGYYAIAVGNIVAPAPRPMTEVADQVREDWTRDTVRHGREAEAAGVLAAVKAGKKLSEAAAGQSVSTLPPVGRAAPAEGVPLQLIDPLFNLKQGEPTMIETPDGFVVAVLAEIRQADPDADPIGFGQVRDALGRSLADDIQAALAFGLRDRAAPRIDRAQADRIAQPE